MRAAHITRASVLLHRSFRLGQLIDPCLFLIFYTVTVNPYPLCAVHYLMVMDLPGFVIEKLSKLRPQASGLRNGACWCVCQTGLQVIHFGRNLAAAFNN